MNVQLTRIQTVRQLAVKIEEILGPNGLNLLGSYNLVSDTNVLQTVPAIQVSYPRFLQKVTYQFVPDSGLEVVIGSEPMPKFDYFSLGNYKSEKFFEIIIDQHDPTGGLTEAIEALMSNRNLDFPEPPVHRGSLKKQDGSGYLPPRAILYHRQAHFKLSTN